MNVASKTWQTVKALPALVGAAWKSASRTYTATTVQLSDWWQGLASLWSKPSYTKLAKKAHANPYAGPGLRLIARTMASVPLTALEPGEDGPEPDPDHELLDLLHRPNPRQTKRHFFDEIVNHLYLGGELFVEARAPQTGRRAGQPRRLYLHRPDRFQGFVKLGEDAPAGFETRLSAETQRLVRDGDIVGYEMQNESGGGTTTYTIDEMHHLRVYNPADPERGLALLLACSRALQGMEAADQWNLTLSNNAGRVPGYLSPKGLENGKQLAPDQVERAEDNLDERIKERRKSNLPMVLSGAFEYEGGAVTPKDADWLESDKRNALKVSAALGVSVLLLGAEKAGSLTDSGLDSEMKMLYLLTVLPLLDFILEELNVWLAPKFDEGLKLSYERDQIEALQEDMTEKYRRYREATGVPILAVDEARQALGFGAAEEAPGPLYVPMGMEAAGAGQGDEGDDPPSLRALREMEDGQFDDVLKSLVAN